MINLLVGCHGLIFCQFFPHSHQCWQLEMGKDFCSQHSWCASHSPCWQRRRRARRCWGACASCCASLPPEINIQKIIFPGLVFQMNPPQESGALTKVWSLREDSPTKWTIGQFLGGNFEKLKSDIFTANCQWYLPNRRPMWPGLWTRTIDSFCPEDLIFAHLF